MCTLTIGTSMLMANAGYPMAKNLRAKIPEDDTMTIFDVNPSSSEKLTKEAVPANIKVAKGPREVAQNSVRKSRLLCHTLMSHIVLSMI